MGGSQRGALGGGGFAGRAACAVLAGLLLSAPTVAAGQATPSPAPRAAACTTPPRPPGEMRDLLAAGLPEIQAFRDGTPVADAATPEAAARNVGEPADAETTAAATAVVEQFVACVNAGDLPAVVALLTDRGARGYLAFGYLAFREILPGEAGAAPPGADALLIDLYLGGIQVRAPLPAAARLSLHGVESVRRLAGGDVEVVVVLATGQQAPRATALRLRDERGALRIVFGPDEARAADATPVP